VSAPGRIVAKGWLLASGAFEGGRTGAHAVVEVKAEVRGLPAGEFAEVARQFVRARRVAVQQLGEFPHDVRIGQESGQGIGHLPVQGLLGGSQR
jgi:hypothetical protein